MAVTQTRQVLSLGLQGAYLTEKREEKKERIRWKDRESRRKKDRKKEKKGREKENMTDIMK